MSLANEAKGVRELGRELAFLSLYMMDISQAPLPDILSFKWYEGMVHFSDEDGNLFSIPPYVKSDLFEFSGQILNGVISNLAQIDSIIKRHLVNWDFSRLHALDKAILRIAIYSLLYQFDIPAEVTIAEANELSEKYCEDNTSNYVNGILHQVKQEYRKNTITETKKAEKIQLKLKGKKKV